jgi:zinc transport system substrate-binding protein
MKWMQLLGGSALLALATGCDHAPPASAKPLVVASFYPLYEFSRQVAGDRATVVSLVPPGVEPHDWEPSPQEMVDLQKARLFVYNGAGFERWVEAVVKHLSGGNTVVVDATKDLDLLTVRGTIDPHAWLDPVLAQAEVDAIHRGLSDVDPANATAYADNARAFKARLTALDAAFRAGLANCESRDVLTPHAAFAYLARRYGLRLIAVTGLTPEAEPSPPELAALVRQARRQKVRYVFTEPLTSSRLAEAIAREIGARTLVLNPIEGLTKEEAAVGKDYVALMQDNLASLRTGLQCS